MFRRSYLFVLFLVFLLSLAISTPVFAANLTVESGDDGTLASLAGNGTCDLREAIEAANTDAAVGECLAGDTGADTIDLDINAVILSDTLIITDDLTIENGTVDGNDATQVFLVSDGAGTVVFDFMTIENGYSEVDGGGIEIGSGNNVTVSNSLIIGNFAANSGGGIYSNTSPLTIESTTIQSNTASFGGGVSSSGTVIISNASGILGNSATDGAGGGVSASSALTISGFSAVMGNEASGNGGGVYSTGTLSIDVGVFVENYSAGEDGGGAIYSRGGGTFSTAVFDGNEADYAGGALYVDGSSLTITESGFVFNFASEVGGSIYINQGSAAVTGSCLFGNSDTSVFNDTGVTLNFTGNWWGEADGPFPTGNGDSVSDFIDFSGFLTEPAEVMGEPCDEGPFEDMMSFTKDDGLTTVAPGQNLTYTLSFSNITDAGGPDLGNIFIDDYLPLNTTYVSCAINVPLTGSCEEVGGIVSFIIDQTLAPGEGGSVTVSVTVNMDATDSVYNEADLYYDDGCGCPPPIYAFDEDIIETTVEAPVIEVFQGGFTPIPNNTGTATFVGAAGTPIISSIEIRNTGTADLALTETINLTGTGFTLLSSFGSTTVTPGNNTTFDVQCDAAADGSYTGSISFENSDSTNSPFTFTLDCQVGDIIVVLPPTLPNGAVNTAYTQAISATGGSGSYTFAVTGGTLPTGLTLAPDGTLSGTPTEGGTYSFTITATDSVTSFYGYRVYSLTIDGLAPTLPPPPPTPVCEDHNFAEGGIVRASTRDGLDYGINCRVLYQNGEPTDWLGGDLYNAGAIGNEGIFDLSVIQAIDIFSPVGWTYFEGGAVFCLRGSGTLIWMAAKNMPRVAEIIGSYTVDDFPGFTCATLFEPGTLVLVRDNPLG